MNNFNPLFKNKFKFYGFLLVFASLAFLSSCSSEYHWVKVKSADPHFAAKSDNYAKATPVVTDEEISPAMATASENDAKATENGESGVIGETGNSAIATSSNLASSKSSTRAEIIKNAELKASDLRSHLSLERKDALNSEDKAVRKQAISQTIHEELAKDAQFSKLPEAKKAMIEKVLINRASNSTSNSASSVSAPNSRHPLANINTLLIVGVVLILVGLIVSLAATGPVGLIIFLIGLIIGILGLLQMLA